MFSFPLPIYHYINKDLFTADSFILYIMSTFQQKSARHTERQKTKQKTTHSSRSWTSIRTRVRYSKDIGIINPGIKNKTNKRL